MKTLGWNSSWLWPAVVCLVIALLLLLTGLLVGSQGLESLSRIGDFSNSGATAGSASSHGAILWEIRLPRSLGAWLAGCLLGLAGCVAQGLFRNPLADPYLLGSASGAIVGVALALAILEWSPAASPTLALLGLTGAAFTGAVVAVALTLLLAGGSQQPLRLLLAGVVVGVVLGAAGSLLTIALPQLLQPMQAFMLGSTAFIGLQACLLMAGVLMVCWLAALLLAPALDGGALGEVTAVSLGLPQAPMRAGLIGVLALATGTAVAQTGLIAFIGLAAPHIARYWVKSTHAGLMLLSSLVGGALLLAADILARGLLAPIELPVGVLTALLGGCYLLRLMHRSRLL